MSKLKTIEKHRLMAYLDFASGDVDIMKLVKWLEYQSQGLFNVAKPTKSMGISEDIRRRGGR